MWIVVLMFATVTAVRSWQVGVPVRDPGGEFLFTRIAISLGLFAALAVLDAARRCPTSNRTVRGVVDVFRRRWPRERLGLAVGALLAYHVVYFCYHNLKSWDAFNTVRDDLLTTMDHWLFFGHSPAVLLHDLLGQHVAAYVLIVIYESFPTLVAVSFVAAVVFVDRLRNGYVFIASMIWVWILGVSTYYLIPSLGPFHFEPDSFAGLPHTIVTTTQAQYMAQRAHLLADPGTGDAFAQVSAFASLHVGISCVIWLMLRYYDLRRAARVMAVYLAGTVLATVYLGWHFFVDDIAGLAIAFLAVALGRLTIYPQGRRELGNGGPPGHRERGRIRDSSAPA